MNIRKRRVTERRVGRRAIGRAAHLRETVVIVVEAVEAVITITAGTECINMWWDTTVGKRVAAAAIRVESVHGEWSRRSDRVSEGKGKGEEGAGLIGTNAGG
jgi:hypothetical protein